MRLPKKTKPYHLKDVKFGLVISVIAISIIGVMVIGSAKQHRLGENKMRNRKEAFILGIVFRPTQSVPSQTVYFRR